MTKKVCISGYYGFDNFGDEIILKILTQNLKNYKKQITVFSVNPKKTSENLDVKSIYTFNPFSVLFSIFKSDCLISGGGSLLQDTTSIKSLIYYLAVIMIAECFNKKVIIFAQGIGPIKNIFFKNLTVFLLKHAFYITVRDENSLKLLSDNGIKNVELCDDPVWNIEIKENKNKSGIGIQLRNSPLITDCFIEKIAFNINKYFKYKKIYILSLQNKFDLEICLKLKSEILNINPEIDVDVIENNSNENIINIISQLEALIAMRYHACLTAIKARVKLLPINYDIKVEMLAKNFNLFCINDKYNIDEIFKTFISTNIKYDETKIQSKKFDFKKLESILNRE